MEKEQLELTLISAGLSKKEAKIYLYLLEKGPQKATSIFKDLKMKKGNTYALLNSLVKEELVEKRGPLFVPQAPLVVFQKLEDKAKALSTSLDNFKVLLPQLSSIYKLAIGKPTIRHFEGEEGIKAVFEDIYAPKKEPVYGCVNLEKADKAFPAYISEQLIPKRIKNKVIAKSLIADSLQAKEIAKNDKDQLRETILVDKKEYPLPAEIDVYEDKIAMLSFKQGEFICLLIENEDFAKSLKSIFKLAFSRGGKASTN